MKNVRIQQTTPPLTPRQRDRLQKVEARRRKKLEAAGIRDAHAAKYAEPPPPWDAKPVNGAERGATGTWFRCQFHGDTQEAVWLAERPYCPAHDCCAEMRLVRGAVRDLPPNSHMDQYGSGRRVR